MERGVTDGADLSAFPDHIIEFSRCKSFSELLHKFCEAVKVGVLRAEHIHIAVC